MNWTPNDIRNVLINPFYAIRIHPTLCAEHEPLVTKEQWIEANAKTINDVGSEAYLRRLLDVLETGGSPGGDAGQH